MATVIKVQASGQLAAPDSTARQDERQLHVSSLLILIFAVSCFLPYPALAIGDAAGLQIGHAISVCMMGLILLAAGVSIRHVVVAAVLYMPLLLSGLNTFHTEAARYVDIVVSNLVVIPLAAVALIPAGILNSRMRLDTAVRGIAWVILFHSVVGAIQLYAFSRFTIPFLPLYQNPSFRPVTELAPSYAASMRPFGLFPEPSAMAASLGPWLVIMIGLLLDPEHRRGLSRPTRWLLAAAAVAGFALVVLSRSGFALALLVAIVLLTTPLVMRSLSQGVTLKNGALTVSYVIAALLLSTLAINQLGDRLEYGTNTSWQLRMQSLVLGARLLGTQFDTLLFGVGPGLSSQLMQTEYAYYGVVGSDSTIVAIWSITVRYIVEAGLLGMTALVIVSIITMRTLLRSSARLLGAICLMLWLFGITFTTSYLTLSPIWLCFGALLAWDRVFPPPTSEAVNTILV